jgi:carboxypeptidase family protein/TonB-dependent receptor-like protein
MARPRYLINDASIRWRRMLTVGACMLFLAVGLGRLQAQQDTLAGAVLDQTGKAIPGAAVSVKNESSGAVTTENTGADGRFSAAGLPAGAYTVEVSATGFNKATRTGVQPGAEDLSITLSVAGVNEAVTVEGVVSLAAQLAPSGNVLDAISAKTEISEQFIRNFTSPVSDFNEVLNIAPGSVIPPTNVFDVPNGAVEKPPKPTLAKTYQGGAVMKFNRWTLDVDAYYIHFQNPYAAVNDPNNFSEPVYVLTGPSNTKGIEAESNIAAGHGVSVYLNGTLGAARYQNTGLWVANAPRDTETVGLTWLQKNWTAGFFNKRVGKMYNDNGSVNQAVPIDPFNVSNLFINYTIRNSSFLRGSKLALSFNNLFDNHNIVGITPGNGPTATVPYAPSGGDFLTLLPGRSVMVSLTVGYAPRR